MYVYLLFTCEKATWVYGWSNEGPINELSLCVSGHFFYTARSDYGLNQGRNQNISKYIFATREDFCRTLYIG